MKKAFTLMEMLVVVLIIGVLSGIAWPRYMRAIEKSRATEAMQHLKTLNDAVYAYAASKDTCPQRYGELLVEIPGASWNAQNKTLTTKDFAYHIGAATNAYLPGTKCPGVVVERLSKGYFLWNPYKVIDENTKKRTIACTGCTAEGVSACKGMGFYTEESPFEGGLGNCQVPTSPSSGTGTTSGTENGSSNSNQGTDTGTQTSGSTSTDTGIGTGTSSGTGMGTSSGECTGEQNVISMNGYWRQTREVTGCENGEWQYGDWSDPVCTLGKKTCIDQGLAPDMSTCSCGTLEEPELNEEAEEVDDCSDKHKPFVDTVCGPCNYGSRTVEYTCNRFTHEWEAEVSECNVPSWACEPGSSSSSEGPECTLSFTAPAADGFSNPNGDLSFTNNGNGTQTVTYSYNAGAFCNSACMWRPLTCPSSGSGSSGSSGGDASSGDPSGGGIGLGDGNTGDGDSGNDGLGACRPVQYKIDNGTNDVVVDVVGDGEGGFIGTTNNCWLATVYCTTTSGKKMRFNGGMQCD